MISENWIVVNRKSAGKFQGSFLSDEWQPCFPDPKIQVTIVFFVSVKVKINIALIRSFIIV